MRSNANCRSFMMEDYILTALDTSADRRAFTRAAPEGMITLATPRNLGRIPAGDFLMGAPDFEEDERPVHRVFVSEFFISRFAVTHDEYARFVRASGYPAPSIRGLPLITLGGRDSMFRELAGPYAWQDRKPPDGHR